MRVLLFLLLGIVSLARGDQEASSNVKDKEDSSIQGDALSPKESMSEKERLFGSFSTTTYTVVSAVTSTVFFSCLSGTDSTVCQGRNAKRFRRGSRTKAIELEGADDFSLPKLEPSAIEEPTAEESSVAGDAKVNDPKFGFTIWTTARTTTSVTVFYTNTSTTIRLSYYCVAGGLQFPANRCAG
ncbi:uncharacterized protein [Palaemon carinicauda]|uniref:uncharacterized protein n=1 Tax=Palaemon carinicauda TaxID=392227 RepID=UPI0035B5EE4C